MQKDIYDLNRDRLAARLTLVLAVALEEEAGGLKRLFLESKPGPVWHPGCFWRTRGSRNLSVLKDLETIRTPRAGPAFLDYLKVKGRLSSS